jgi:hypothetical protein
MRKIALIFGLMLGAGLTGNEVYHFFVTDDGVGYFTSQPHRLLYVASLGVIGGLMALAFNRVSLVVRRTLRLVTLGGFGASATAFLAIFAANTASLASMVKASGMSGWVIAALASLSIVTVLVWLEFYFVWRQH